MLQYSTENVKYFFGGGVIFCSVPARFNRPAGKWGVEGIFIFPWLKPMGYAQSVPPGWFFLSPSLLQKKGGELREIV